MTIHLKINFQNLPPDANLSLSRRFGTAGSFIKVGTGFRLDHDGEGAVQNLLVLPDKVPDVCTLQFALRCQEIAGSQVLCHHTAKSCDLSSKDMMLNT